MDNFMKSLIAHHDLRYGIINFLLFWGVVQRQDGRLWICLQGFESSLPSHLVPSSRGLGRGPLKAKTRVRIPLGPPIKILPMEIKLYILTGTIINEFPGRQFVWSADKRKLAMGGWFPHLTSEPYYKSDYIEINESPYSPPNKEFWQTAEGESAIYPTPSEREQEISQKKYHIFQSDISWSSDGGQVAVVDEFGDESTRNQYLVIVNVQTKTVNKISLQSSMTDIDKIYWSTDKRYIYLARPDRGWVVDSDTNIVTEITIEQLKAKVPAYADELRRDQIIKNLDGSEANWYFGN